MNFLRLSQNDLLASCGKLIFNHADKEDYGTAYEQNEKCSLTLYIPRKLGASEVEITIFDESLSEIKYENSALFEDFINNDDVYSISIPLKKLGVGLFLGKIRIKTLLGCFYACKNFNELIFTNDKSTTSFQLTVSNFSYSPPVDKYGGIIYHIFVDRFARGKEEVPRRNDAVIIEDWYSEIPEYPEYPGAYLENNTFFGGTLWGVIEKLDYLFSLGVNLIYLSPIFKAYSNHKYDTGDYMTVDEMFGGEEALKALIVKAGERGIGIILDGVFNHTGADSLYFNKFGKYDTLGAYQSNLSPYFSWYDFQNHPDKYTSWWGIDILPRINPNVNACGEFLAGESGVVEKYAKMGIQGLRLDVADELSDEFIAKIKSTLNKHNKGSVLYGEVWEDASNKIAYDNRKRYYLGTELDGVMNYPTRTAIISFLKFGRTEDLEYLFYDVIPNAPKRIRDAQMNLIGTHDTERIITVLGGEDSKNKDNSYLLNVRMTEKELDSGRKRLFMAYTISATLPGIPAIFYGDEAGLEGYSDPFNRRTFPWCKEDKKILDFYRKIGKIRRENQVYKKGCFKPIIVSGDLLIFERYDSELHYISVINNSNTEKNLYFNSKSSALINGISGKTITVSPFSAEIIKTKDKNFSYV